MRKKSVPAVLMLRFYGTGNVQQKAKIRLMYESEKFGRLMIIFLIFTKISSSHPYEYIL